MKESIGSAIRRLREERGITQGKLSRLSGVPSQTLSGVETGRSKPGVDVMCKISEAMGLTPNDILKKAGILPTENIRDGEPSYQDPLIERVVINMVNMDQKDREFLMEFSELLLNHSKRD